MNTEQLQSDLAYVRETVSGARRSQAPAAIPLLWAAIVTIGFPIVDFAPRSVGLYWAFAGPIGFLASAALGWWSSRRYGQVSRSEGLKYAAHWGALLIAIVLSSALAVTKQITGEGFGALILLLLAVFYFLGGLHLERRMGWVSLVPAGGYMLVLFVSAHVWTVIGAALALSLVIVAFAGEPKRAEAV